MDLDAGRVATGEMLVEEARQALFGLLIDVASGLAVTAADRLSLYNDLTLFNPAPVI
jgi:galactarate dehydratase